MLLSNKQWLVYQYWCALQFRKNGSENLDTISLIGVQECFTVVTTEEKQPPRFV
jgi:hypothetical protein